MYDNLWRLIAVNYQNHRSVGDFVWWDTEFGTWVIGKVEQ